MDMRDLARLQWVRAAAAAGTARRIRNDAGLTQAEIAQVVQVSQATIALWEQGNRVPRGAPALRYAEVLERLARASDRQRMQVAL